MIINFEKAKIQKYIKNFEQGSLPNYLTDRMFLNDFKNINEVINDWARILDDKDMLPVLKEIYKAYIEFARTQTKEKLTANQILVDELNRFKINMKTKAKKFWNPTVHSGYPKDENPVLIFSYEFTTAHQNFTKNPFSLPENEKFILQLGKIQRDEMRVAILDDLNTCIDILKDWSDTNIDEQSMEDLSEIKELKELRYELLISLNTVETIMK